MGCSSLAGPASASPHALDEAPREVEAGLERHVRLTEVDKQFVDTRLGRGPRVVDVLAECP